MQCEQKDIEAAAAELEVQRAKLSQISASAADMLQQSWGSRDTEGLPIARSLALRAALKSVWGSHRSATLWAFYGWRAVLDSAAGVQRCAECQI